MTTNDGGPAFPFWPDMMRVDENGRAEPVGGKGMTLRDWFAGQALIGVMANTDFSDLNDEYKAELAFDTADAMLAERSKP